MSSNSHLAAPLSLAAPYGVSVMIAVCRSLATSSRTCQVAEFERPHRQVPLGFAVCDRYRAPKLKNVMNAGDGSCRRSAARRPGPRAKGYGR